MQLYTKILIAMAIGVVLGFFLGPNSQFLKQDSVILNPGVQVFAKAGGSTVVPQSLGIERAAIDEEGTDGWLKVSWELNSRDLMRLQANGLRACEAEGETDCLRAGDMHSGWVQGEDRGVRKFAQMGQTLVDLTEWIGRLFLALIKMVVVPLVFFSLILGMASLGDFRKLGRMGGMTIGFFTMTTVVALSLGLLLTNLIRPGDLLSPEDKANLLGSFTADKVMAGAADAPSLIDQLVAIVPSNPFGSLAGGDMLQVIFFAAMLGVALTLMDQKKAKRAVDLCDAANEAMIILVHMAMKVAPYGVGALLFEVVGSTGLSVLGALAAYGGVVLLGLTCHILIAYLPVVIMVARLPFLGFIQAIRAALVLAFSTSSSSATLPVTMEACESNLKVSNEVTSFVLPIGATVNMDGTALYQGVAALFIAQIYGIDLTLGDQATIVFSATMASIGAAGVPGAGMLTLAMVLAAVGVPVQGVALVIGVDRLLDMFRTTTNVIGDSTATVLVARMQGDAIRVVSPDEDAADAHRGMEGRLEEVDPNVVEAEANAVDLTAGDASDTPDAAPGEGDPS